MCLTNTGRIELHITNRALCRFIQTQNKNIYRKNAFLKMSETIPHFDDIKYPYDIMGFTVPESGKYICNKCGKQMPPGIIGLSIHWNECIDERKTLSVLMPLRQEKGSELTIADIKKILP